MFFKSAIRSIVVFWYLKYSTILVHTLLDTSDTMLLVPLSGRSRILSLIHHFNGSTLCRGLRRTALEYVRPPVNKPTEIDKVINTYNSDPIIRAESGSNSHNYTLIHKCTHYIFKLQQIHCTWNNFWYSYKNTQLQVYNHSQNVINSDEVIKWWYHMQVLHSSQNKPTPWHQRTIVQVKCSLNKAFSACILEPGTYDTCAK